MDIKYRAPRYGYKDRWSDAAACIACRITGRAKTHCTKPESKARKWAVRAVTCIMCKVTGQAPEDCSGCRKLEWWRIRWEILYFIRHQPRILYRTALFHISDKSTTLWLQELDRVIANTDRLLKPEN